MKLLVIVREVAQPDDDFTVGEGSIAEEHLEYELNEWDEYAVEAAVQIAENHTDVETVAAMVGPERAEETLRMSLAKGLDRAVRVWDDKLEGVTSVASEPRILEQIVADEDPDLVLCGVQAADDTFGTTGVSLAESVGFEHAAVVTELQIEDADTISVRRELEGGLQVLTDVELPAVVTIQVGINEPRYASLRGIRQAQEKDITVASLADLGLSSRDLDNPLELAAMYDPTSESTTEFFDGSPSETAGKLATTLREIGGAE